MSAAPPGLTAREREVLVLVAEGRTNQAIGHALQVSPRTVAKHLEHAYRKLEVSSRVQAVALAVPAPREGEPGVVRADEGGRVVDARSREHHGPSGGPL